MAEITSDQTARRFHCDAFLRENGDPDIRRPAQTFGATPLDQLAAKAADEGLPAYIPTSTTVRRSVVTLTTAGASFDVWAALANLEHLLSDYKRIAPRYSFLQTAGEASIAVGNEYRLTLSAPDLIEPLNEVFSTWDGARQDRPVIEKRVMDVRVIRAGPWGGETGELIFEALTNHALAGASSLWILAHDETDRGALRVTLDALEIARWAWAPDFLADHPPSADAPGARIINWDYLFERLAQVLDGVPEAIDPGAVFSVTDAPGVLARDARISEALRISMCTSKTKSISAPYS